MSKSSIYEASWTNLVFENKNKEYGAYQLRQENSKTTITALFMGLLLLAALGSVSILINKFSTVEPVEEPVIYDPITPITIDPTIVQPKQPETVAPPQQSAPAAASTATQLSHPVVATVDQATPEIATNVNNVTGPENPAGTGTSSNPVTQPGGGIEDVVTVAPITNEPVIPALLDKLPEFPGGMAKFYTYVGNNFNRPELEAGRTLKVYVSFVIEKDGSITDIMVKNDPGYGLGKEAIRVLKSLKTKWVPGVLNGKAVRTAYNLPITIKGEE